MIKHNQDGAVSGVAISLILSVVLLIGAVAFGAWAFMSRQDYKDNTDQKIIAAVTVAKQQESTAKDKQFAEDEKKPLRSYQGPEVYGSLTLQYPKTWSGIVDDNGKSGATLIDGFFYPNIVPSITDTASIFALRVQVISQPYAEVLKTLTALQQDKEKPVSITPYALPKVPKVVGVQVSGALPNSKTGMMVILPLRSETLQIWTEGNQFTGDFTNSILPNLSFLP
jgi:hypothetical protein